MSRSFCLPDLGEGIHEAEVLVIHVAVGQSINEGDPLLAVETDKAAVEIPSPITGIVAEILAAKGHRARVGDPLISFADTAAIAPVAEAGENSSILAVAVSGEEKRSGRPVPASPATRRLARELGVDLRQVPTGGRGGLVGADDVRAVAAARGARQESGVEAEGASAEGPVVAAPVGDLPDFSQWGPIVREPFRSIRRATARRMSNSWQNIPHVNCQDTVDITRLENFRQKHKVEIEAAGGRLTMTVFAMKAVATALKTFPHFNASLDLVAQEIIVKNYFHIGIATATEHGLLVPVIRDVDRKSIRELAQELPEILGRARARQNSRDELLGGTFTITNVGGLGGSFFTAIINHPEVAILGLGEGRMQPVVVAGDNGGKEIVPRLMMPIILCFDHRVVDGADAVCFLRQVMGLLEDPEELFISMI